MYSRRKRSLELATPESRDTLRRLISEKEGLETEALKSEWSKISDT